ncbi:MAG: glycoside hydrolase family 16 protein [Prevotella sp.]|nr:glycoside hydrolase family 16 protein [Prevotella sp.]MBR6494826.1 glycoside hydrolase family 16 protein [Prevotella sp.]
MRSKEVISKKIANFVGEISKHQTMRTLFCSILTLFLLVSDGSQMTISAQQPAEYQLVFSDEFNQSNGSQPDSTKWGRSLRENNGWARWVSNSPKVVYIKNGRLICRGIPNKSEPTDTATMLTGSVDTKDRFSFQYGKVEVRMKTNLKIGNFPAIWMMPQPDRSSDKRYGEIDIVEMFGNEGMAAHSAHTHRSYILKKEGLKRQFRTKVDVTKWHVYGIIWTKDKIVWTIDGAEVAEYHRIDSPVMNEEGQWTFSRPFFLRLNQSVGDYSHPLLIPDLKGIYETQFDWVRIYQEKNKKL